jgi:hypothetical protein
MKEIRMSSRSRGDDSDRVATSGDGSFQPGRTWTFISHHAQVLLAVAEDPELRVTDIATAAGITQRSAYRILADRTTAMRSPGTYRSATARSKPRRWPTCFGSQLGGNKRSDDDPC